MSEPRRASGLGCLIRWRPATADDVLTVVGIPHAGAGAGALRAFAAAAPADWDVVGVRLAGRERRVSVPPATSMAESVAEIAGEIIADPDIDRRPVVLVGQCSGALLAFDAARALVEAGRPPSALVVIGCGGPGNQYALPDPAGTDADFLAAMEPLGGVPAEVMADPEIVGLFLPPLRADVTAIRARPAGSGERLPLPIFTIRGAADGICSDADLDAWSAVTSIGVERAHVPGGHLALSGSPDAVVAQIASGLRGVLAGMS